MRLSRVMRDSSMVRTYLQFDDSRVIGGFPNATAHKALTEPQHENAAEDTCALNLFNAYLFGATVAVILITGFSAFHVRDEVPFESGSGLFPTWRRGKRKSVCGFQPATFVQRDPPRRVGRWVALYVVVCYLQSLFVWVGEPKCLIGSTQWWQPELELSRNGLWLERSVVNLIGPWSSAFLLGLFLDSRNRFDEEVPLHRWSRRFAVTNFFASWSHSFDVLRYCSCGFLMRVGQVVGEFTFFCWLTSLAMVATLYVEKVRMLGWVRCTYIARILLAGYTVCLGIFIANVLFFWSQHLRWFALVSSVIMCAIVHCVTASLMFLSAHAAQVSSTHLDAEVSLALSWTRWSAGAACLSGCLTILILSSAFAITFLHYDPHWMRMWTSSCEALSFVMHSWCAAYLSGMVGPRVFRECAMVASKRTGAAAQEWWDDEYRQSSATSPEDEVLQAEIVESIISEGEPSEDPWVVYLAGGPGSGKGTTLEFLWREKYLPTRVPIIDVDAIRSMFREWKCAESRAATLATREEKRKIMAEARAVTQAPAGRVADTAVDQCIANDFSFVFDSTVRKREWALEDFQHKKKSGYKVVLIFIDTEESVCQQRVLEREARTGRPVGEDFVRECNVASRQTVQAIKHEADLFVHVLNNTQPLVQGSGISQMGAFFLAAPVSFET